MSIQTGAITLGGIALNNSLQWTNRFDFVPVVDNVRRTLGGGQVIYSQLLTAGQPIILEATQGTGWLTKSMVDSIITLANSPNVNRALVFHSETYTVRFAYDDGTPVSFRSLLSKQVLTADDWMIGTINLYTV